jgi:hypothetical protein
MSSDHIWIHILTTAVNPQIFFNMAEATLIKNSSYMVPSSAVESGISYTIATKSIAIVVSFRDS